MSILFRPSCWMIGHSWVWLIRGRVQVCEMCDKIRNVA